MKIPNFRFFCNYISRDFILKSRAAGNPEAESMSVLGVAEEHEELISEFVLKILNLDMKGIEETLLGSLDSNTNSPEFFLKSRIEKYGFFLHEEDRNLAVREALEKLYEKEKELW